MSNTELVKAGRKALSTETTQRAVGKTVALGGGATLGIYALASLIPFVGPVFVAVLLVILGGYLYLK